MRNLDLLLQSDSTKADTRLTVPVYMCRQKHSHLQHTHLDRIFKRSDSEDLRGKSGICMLTRIFLGLGKWLCHCKMRTWVCLSSTPRKAKWGCVYLYPQHWGIRIRRTWSLLLTQFGGKQLRQTLNSDFWPPLPTNPHTTQILLPHVMYVLIHFCLQIPLSSKICHLWTSFMAYVTPRASSILASWEEYKLE